MENNKPIHPGNFECFIEVFTQKLLRFLETHPQDYAYSKEQLPILMPRFRESIKTGNFNKDGHAIKATCKELKIKHTYKAIKEFISL